MRIEAAASARSMDLGMRHTTDRPLVMLTFGNKAVWPMLSNWVANVRKAGLGNNMLVGALDPQLVRPFYQTPLSFQYFFYFFGQRNPIEYEG